MSQNEQQQTIEQAEDDDKRWETGRKPTQSEWGRESADHYGYASEEERRERRGLEDWELTEKMAASRKRVPLWFFVVIGIVLLAAFGLSLPFWGDRPDHPRPWLTWGHLLAVVYLLVAGGFVYFMVNVFNPESPDEEECDPSGKRRGKDEE